MIGVDDEDALAAAMVEAVNDPDTRQVRSENASEQIRSEYSRRALAGRFTGVYQQASADAAARAASIRLGDHSSP